MCSGGLTRRMNIIADVGIPSYLRTVKENSVFIMPCVNISLDNPTLAILLRHCNTNIAQLSITTV